MRNNSEVKPDPKFTADLVNDLKQRETSIGTELTALDQKRAKLVTEQKRIKAALRELG